jgi:hypothetical protein
LAAEGWYRSALGLFLVSPPPLVMAHLHHSRSQAIAHRRLFFGFALPWLILWLAVTVFSALVFVTTYERWWEYTSAPGQRHDVDSVTTGYRPLGVSDEFARVHEPRSLVPSKVYRIALAGTGVRLTTPQPDKDLIVFLFGFFLYATLSLATAYVITLIGVAYIRWRDRSGISPRAAIVTLAWLAPANVILVMCLGLIVAIASFFPRAEGMIVSVLAIGVLFHLGWGVIVMAKLGGTLCVRASFRRVVLGLVALIAWFVPNATSVVWFSAMLLTSTRE